MKIKLWSDLHLDRTAYKYSHIWTPSNDDKETTLVLAGDISETLLGEDFINAMCSAFKHVVRVCGNHEFYDTDYNDTISKHMDFEQVGPSNYHFLHNDWRILDGVRFLGGTMWTSFNDGEILDKYAAMRVMYDFAYIKSKNKPIDADFIIAEHDKFISFLLKKFDEPFDGKTVVITHHSPGSPIRRGTRSMSDRSVYAYYADIEQCIGHHDKAHLWVHGHTHTNFDYMINNTRVVCNPYGYHNYHTNGRFDKDLILEI